MQDKNDDMYEKICFICRRPENVTGKQVVMPGGISICPDCMQKTFDAIEHTGPSMNIPGMDMFHSMFDTNQTTKDFNKETFDFSNQPPSIIYQADGSKLK